MTFAPSRVLSRNTHTHTYTYADNVDTAIQEFNAYIELVVKLHGPNDRQTGEAYERSTSVKDNQFMD